jgi:phage baseplate assembly protein W
VSGAWTTGWGFPLSVDARGRVALHSGCGAVDAALAVLIGTVAGERPMRPDFGIRLDWTTEELPDRIRELVETFEPRIDVSRVELVDSASIGYAPATRYLRGMAVVRIGYVLRSTGERWHFEGSFEWIE